MGDFSINGSSNFEVGKTEILSFKPVFRLPLSRISTVRCAVGEFLFQHYEDELFELWLSEYRASESLTIFATVERRMLELTFVLRDEMTYTMEGFGTVRMPGSSFNLSHEPYVVNQLDLRKGVSITFDIHIKESYLQQFCAQLPELAAYLEQVAKGHFSLLSKIAMPVSVSAQSMIHALLYAGDDPAFIRQYLQSQVDALLMKALSELLQKRPTPIKASTHEADAIVSLERFLTDNLNTQLSLLELAQKFAINDFKMKRLFFQTHGKGVHAFLTDRRMEKAQELLLQTDMPIFEICFTLGYKNANYLSDVFRRKFGLSPQQFRLRA